jgi:hypothetical protein
MGLLGRENQQVVHSYDTNTERTNIDIGASSDIRTHDLTVYEGSDRLPASLSFKNSAGFVRGVD